MKMKFATIIIAILTTATAFAGGGDSSNNNVNVSDLPETKISFRPLGVPFGCNIELKIKKNRVFIRPSHRPGSFYAQVKNIKQESSAVVIDAQTKHSEDITIKIVKEAGYVFATALRDGEIVCSDALLRTEI